MDVAILIGIVLKLLNAPTTANELAKKFEVSTRSIYRYIETLCQAGVPIVSVMGKHGGFSIQKNFELNQVFFTQNEIDEMINLSSNEVLKQKLEFLKSKN